MATTDLKAVYVAKYEFDPDSKLVTYTGGRRIGGAVNHNMTPTAGKAALYADGAESITANYTTGGTLTHAIADLTDGDKAFITGIAAVPMEINGRQVNIYPETDEIQPPYLGYGTVRVGMDVNNKVWYQPIIYPKIKYGVSAESYTTKGETITITAESLTASVLKEDVTGKWRINAERQESLEAAIEVVEFILGENNSSRKAVKR